LRNNYLIGAESGFFALGRTQIHRFGRDQLTNKHRENCFQKACCGRKFERKSDEMDLKYKK